VRRSRNEWFVSGSIAGGIEYPINLVRINFLNHDSDIMLKLGFKSNSIPQN